MVINMQNLEKAKAKTRTKTKTSERVDAKKADIRKKAEEKALEDIGWDSKEVREKRMRDRDAERLKRRERRIRQLRMYRICTVAVLLLIICGIGGLFVWNNQSVKLLRKLSAGNKYTENGDYDKAQASYEEAIKIDSGTVEAYRYLAQNDIAQDDSAAAKEILYEGWENTQDESLLHYYCVVILNEVVAELNNKEYSLETVDKCIQVLQLEPENEDALSLLDICYERLYTAGDEDNALKMFMDETATEDSCQYDDYEKQIRDLLQLYTENGTKEIENILVKYAIIDKEYVYLSVPHLSAYQKLLEDINKAVSDKSVGELYDCLSYAIEIEEEFADLFKEFADGNYESAKEFIVSDTYVQIRDYFINEESGFWEGHSSIPINTEQMVIHKIDDGFKFYWLDYVDYDDPQGVITVWGNRQLDDGIQRTSISYEPPGKNGEYYPHTEYVISYEYSNVLENGTDVKMNYRFITINTTEEGAETEAIGDWGGENEWSTSY